MVATRDGEGRRVSLYGEEGFKALLAVPDPTAERVLAKEIEVRGPGAGWRQICLLRLLAFSL